MKHYYLGLLLSAAFSLNVSGQKVIDKAGEKLSMEKADIHYVNAPMTRAQTADELLGCPEGTVLGGEFSSEADYVGFQSSDQGRPGMPTKFYQSFSECYYTINGVRILGILNYYDGESNDWLTCDGRGGVNAEGEMTEPIRMEVSFYRINADGEPGEVVFTKEVDILGNYLGVQYSGGNIYEFAADLGEDIKMESGFLSVSAVDMKDAPSCWFSVLCATSVPGYGMVSLGDNGLMGAALPMCYCLKGSGEFSAHKALKMVRILTPDNYSGEKYEKVQVELMNVGSDDIENARLELWADGKLLATESVDVAIKSLESYKYVFKQRIDCSAPGVHHFEVRNVTAGDEKLCDDALAFTTSKMEEGSVCESESEDSSYEYITSVKIGDINCQSDNSGYSDYTDMKTTIIPGEELELTVENEGSGVYIGVWVDWNNNGTFDDAGEFISYIPDGTIKVSIPEDVDVTAGEKRMRIILSYGETTPCGIYQYGETEDYTLVVSRPDASPAIDVNVKSIEAALNHDSKKVELEIANNGTLDMTGNISVNYLLPYSPNNRYVSRIADNPDVKEKMQPRKVACKDIQSAPEAGDESQYTLRYDMGQQSGIALTNYPSATYAQYYPGDMLSNLTGMQISSIDVYLLDAAQKSSVVVYGENSQSAAGEELLNQSFVPVVNSWNHIVLDKPVTITDKDMWIGVKLEGFDSDKYYIGIDAGKALRGFGDVVNVGGETWWSMGDLGINSNFCIRANVTGDRTPAISWLTMDKKDFNIAANQKQTVNADLDATKLAETLYEAVIEIKSNDALTKVVKIPVYMTNGAVTGLDKNEMLQSSIRFNADRSLLIVESGSDMKRVVLTDIAGKNRKDVNNIGQQVELSLAGLNTGIYILSIEYTDGNKETIKLPVTR